MAQKKPNPLEATIALVGKPGEPDIAIGKVPFHVLHVEGNRALIAGVLLDDAGRRIGKVEIDGFPTGDLPKSKPAGRPKLEEKHLAVFLAWALDVAMLGGQKHFIEADEVTAKRFCYLNSEGRGNAKTVRDIRSKHARKFGLDLDNDSFHIASSSGNGNPPLVPFLSRSQLSTRRKPAGLKFLVLALDG